jgi:hypothetical protein
LVACHPLSVTYFLSQYKYFTYLFKYILGFSQFKSCDDLSSLKNIQDKTSLKIENSKEHVKARKISFTPWQFVLHAHFRGFC